MCNKIKLQNVTERGRNDGRENAYFQCGNEGYESNLESGGDGNGAGGAVNSEEGGRGMYLSDRSNLFKTADGEGDFRGNEEGKQALLFPFGKQRTV